MVVVVVDVVRVSVRAATMISRTHGNARGGGAHGSTSTGGTLCSTQHLSTEVKPSAERQTSMLVAQAPPTGYFAILVLEKINLLRNIFFFTVFGDKNYF